MIHLPAEIICQILSHISNVSDIISLLLVNKYLNSLVKISIDTIDAPTLPLNFIMGFPNIRCVTALISISKNNLHILAGLKKLQQINIMVSDMSMFLYGQRNEQSIKDDVSIITNFYLKICHRKNKRIRFVRPDDLYFQIEDNGFNMKLDYLSSDESIICGSYEYFKPLMIEIEKAEGLHWISDIFDSDNIFEIGKNHPNISLLSQHRYGFNVSEFINLTSINRICIHPEMYLIHGVNHIADDFHGSLSLIIDGTIVNKPIYLNKPIYVNIPIYYKHVKTVLKIFPYIKEIVIYQPIIDNMNFIKLLNGIDSIIIYTKSNNPPNIDNRIKYRSIYNKDINNFIFK